MAKKKTTQCEEATASGDLASLAIGLSVSGSGRIEAEPGSPIWQISGKARLQTALAALRAAGGLDWIAHLDLGHADHPGPPRSATDVDPDGTGARALTDLSLLSGLKTLRTLDACQCVALTTVDLSELPSVTDMDLSSCTSLSTLRLSQLPKLLRVYTEPMHIDFDGDSNRGLCLSGCARISSICLSDLASLHTIDLTGYYQDIESEHTTSLRSLTELSLKALPQVSELRCAHSPLTTLALPPLPSLIRLELFQCRELTELSGLSGLEALASLDLWGCEKLTDLGPLSGLPSLTSLDLTGCCELRDEHQRRIEGADLQDWLSTLGSTAIARTRGAKKKAANRKAKRRRDSGPKKQL